MKTKNIHNLYSSAKNYFQLIKKAEEENIIGMGDEDGMELYEARPNTGLALYNNPDKLSIVKEPDFTETSDIMEGDLAWIVNAKVYTGEGDLMLCFVEEINKDRAVVKIPTTTVITSKSIPTDYLYNLTGGKEIKCSVNRLMPFVDGTRVKYLMPEKVWVEGELYSLGDTWSQARLKNISGPISGDWPRGSAIGMSDTIPRVVNAFINKVRKI